MELSSSLIFKIVRNLEVLNYMSPFLCDQIFQYIYENRNYISGEITYQTLYFLYLIGYNPESRKFLTDGRSEEDSLNNEKLDFSSFENVIERDFELMSSMKIIRTSIALCYYGHLPQKLISRIFDPDFIRRTEKEVLISTRMVG